MSDAIGPFAIADRRTRRRHHQHRDQRHCLRCVHQERTRRPIDHHWHHAGQRRIPELSDSCNDGWIRGGAWHWKILEFLALRAWQRGCGQRQGFHRVRATLSAR